MFGHFTTLCMKGLNRTEVSLYANLLNNTFHHTFLWVLPKVSRRTTFEKSYFRLFLTWASTKVIWFYFPELQEVYNFMPTTTNIYLFKVNNRNTKVNYKNTRKSYEIYSELTIKTHLLLQCSIVLLHIVVVFYCWQWTGKFLLGTRQSKTYYE